MFRRCSTARKTRGLDPNRCTDEADPDLFYNAYWRPVTWLFREDREGARKVDRLLYDLLVPKEGVRPLVVIDLSEEQAKHGYTTEPEETSTMFWNETRTPFKKG